MLTKHTYTSLRTKIFLRFTLLVGLALIATGTLSVVIARNSIRNQIVGELSSLTEKQSREIEELINSRRSLTRLLALDTDIVAFAERGIGGETLRKQLLQKEETIQSLQSVAILNRTGQVRVATDSQFEGIDLSGIPHFARGKLGTYVGPLRIVEGKKSFVISTPIRGADGTLQGVLLAEYDLTDLYHALSVVHQLGRTGEFLLLEPESNGGYCTNPKNSVLSQQSALIDITNNEQGLARMKRIQGKPSLLCSLAAAGQEGILHATDGEGKEVIASHIYLRDAGLGLIAKVEEQEIFAPVRLLLTVLTGTTAILLLLVVFISLRLAHDVVDPILRLRKSLEHLDTGHWIHKRSIFTGDELEVLDKEAKRLASRLKEAYSSLEEKVRERTHELAEDHAKDEALLESIGEGFLAIDMNGKIMTSNSAGEKMLQWSKKEIIGSHFGTVLNLRTKDGKMVAQQSHFIQRAINEKALMQTTPTETFLCERKDGTSFPISLTATPFLMGMEMRGVVVTFRDITEEKRIDRMKSEFISLASHQLRTPLTAIGWYIELLQGGKEGLTEDQIDYLSQIMDSHTRMVDLVNSLLNVSRIELGRLKIAPEKTSIDHIVEKATHELKLQMEKKKLLFNARYPKGLEVEVDLRLVQMVLENLLSNSIKYTKDGGQIDLAILSDGHELRFEVHDTGMGIPKEQQKRIFEKLFRADNVVKTDTEGTGIGLYIARSTAEAWGGRLWFESTEGKGTTFYFTAPLKMKKVESLQQDWGAGRGSRSATANTEEDSSSHRSE